MAKICIVLATYNGSRYLSQMLDSLVAQNRPADLIIAVDDGSKDETPRILQYYSDKLPLHIEVHQVNQGHRAAFSRALELARKKVSAEDYIALADQDDVWLPQKLETLERELDANASPALVFGDAQVIDGEGKVTAESWRKVNQLQDHLSTDALLTGFTNVTGCMVMFKASIIDQILPIPVGVPVHDQWITLCASVLGGYKAIDTPVIQYRIHGNNTIGMGHSHTWTGNLKLNLEWARAVEGSSLFHLLGDDSQRFLKNYIGYVGARLDQWILPSYLFWAAKNCKALYPHIKHSYRFIPRFLFSIVGAKFATKFLGKK